MSVKAAFSPKGTRIIGTLETIEGRANARQIWHNGNQVEVEYEGDTEVFWDSQRTQERDGKDLFLDDDGDEWAEDELTFREIETDHLGNEIDPCTCNEGGSAGCPVHDEAVRMDKLDPPTGEIDPIDIEEGGDGKVY